MESDFKNSFFFLLIARFLDEVNDYEPPEEAASTPSSNPCDNFKVIKQQKKKTHLDVLSISGNLYFQFQKYNMTVQQSTHFTKKNY